MCITALLRISEGVFLMMFSPLCMFVCAGMLCVQRVCANEYTDLSFHTGGAN